MGPADLRILAALGLAAALGSASVPARADWLGEEWRSYRTYPRLNAATRLFENRQYPEARKYVEEVESIDPDNREAALLGFEICVRQRDYTCIRELGERWQSRNPGSALGPAMLAYVSLVDGRTADLIRQAQAALLLPGLTPRQRSAMGHGWVNGLLRLGRTGEAKAALAWLDDNKVAVARHDRETWQKAFAQAEAARKAPPAAAPSQIARTTPTVKSRPQPPIASAAASGVVTRTVPAQRPRRVAAAPAAPPPPPETAVIDMIKKGHYAEAVAQVQQLQSAGRLSPQAREAVVLNLQGHDCASVLQLVPPDASAPLITARQQLAAGYCSGGDARLASRHFVAARTLAGTDPTLSADALAGKGQSLAQLGDNAGAQAALAEAVRLKPDDAQIHAAYGHQLKAAGADERSLQQFEAAFRLDNSRTELLPEMALLAHRLNRPDDAIRWNRAAIDDHASIGERLDLDDDEAQQRMFAWRREVQTEEDRINWYANVNMRLDQGPKGSQVVSPADYQQYAGSLNLGASYRLNPFGAQLPTWVFVRASQGLQDQSLSLEPDTQLVGAGVRQRLSKDYLIVGSVEYLWRQSAQYNSDVMVRLSGSHTWGGDWNPVDASWTYANIYGDLAWLVRERSHFITVLGELGRQYKLPNIPFKAAIMPYLTGGYADNNDNSDRLEVTRLDVGVGLALFTWHWEDTYRAPALNQRLSLEVRWAIAGNTRDRQTVQLKWTMLH